MNLPDEPRVVILRPTDDPLLYDAIDYRTRERICRVKVVHPLDVARLVFMSAVISVVVFMVLWVIYRL